MGALKDIFTGGVSRRSTTGKSPNGEAEASARAVGITRAARGGRCKSTTPQFTETKRTVKRSLTSNNGCSLETTNAAPAPKRARLGEPRTELPYGVAAWRDTRFQFQNAA